MKKIYVSGMHSGQNPSSGLGISRCLKKAFPQLTLVGVDHWQGSSGLNEKCVDETLLLPLWNHIDDKLHASNLRTILNDGNLWITALDVEVHWLSEQIGPHAHLLSPGGSALEATAKPAVRGFGSMGFRVPEFVEASLPDSELHAFLRQNSWRCWLKSPYHDAKRVSSWSAFERTREQLSSNWKTSKLFVQRNVIGSEESIAFAAYQGELVGAVYMEKKLITPEGKTWAGRVTPLSDPELLEQLRESVRGLEWSGGGELEFTRDADGARWIIECNPRFPAWIYGAALAGHNLPAQLVARAWNLPLLESVTSFPFFTRVVHEIPVKESVGLPLLVDPTAAGWCADGKTGKGGPSFSSLLPTLRNSTHDDEADEDEDGESPAERQQPEKIPEALASEVEEIAKTFQGETPARIHLENWTRARFQALAAKTRAHKSQSPEIRIAYSVKTSPTDDYLRKAKENGFYAECISQLEVQRALQFGFDPGDVILNGPGKFWPLTAPPARGLHMLFCDSIEEFDRVLLMPDIARCVGFRIRLPSLHSRFGNSLGDFETFQRIVSAVRQLKGKAEVGFHFHMPSWAIGVTRWRVALQSLLLWCQSMEQLSEVPVRHLDLGGGFFPADLARLDFASVREEVHAALPSVKAIYFEPGRSITQDCEVLVSRVLDVRRVPGKKGLEVVVDACVAELPLAQAYPHRIHFLSQDSGPGEGCILLPKGESRILGRICMEDDILGHQFEIPESVNIGDLVIFGDAGGYERSMSYVFGRG